MTANARRVVLPAGGSWFAGHFPGHPILPGVAHLALLDRPLASVVSLRLRVPLLPGDDVEILEEAAGEKGRLRVSLRRDGVLASRALVEIAGTDEEGSRVGDGTDTESASNGDDPSPWIPHRPPIRCVERLRHADEAGAECRVRLPDVGAFAAGGRVPAFFALECAAQATAAWEAARRVRAGEAAEPRTGYLVGARDASFAAPWFAAGACGTVGVRIEGHAPPLAVYRFEMEFGGRGVASGTIQVWLPT